MLTRYDLTSNDDGAVRKRNAYKGFLTSVLTRIYNDSGVGSGKVDAEAILAAQMKIAEVTPTLLQRRNDSNRVQLTVRELIAKKKWNKVRAPNAQTLRGRREEEEGESDIDKLSVPLPHV